MGIDWWRNDPMLLDDRAGAGRGEPAAPRAPRGAGGGLGRTRRRTARVAERGQLPVRRRPADSTPQQLGGRLRPDGRPRSRCVEHRGLQAVVVQRGPRRVRRGGAARATSRPAPGWRRSPALTTTWCRRQRRARPPRRMRLVTICSDDDGVREHGSTSGTTGSRPLWTGWRAATSGASRRTPPSAPASRRRAGLQAPTSGAAYLQRKRAQASDEHGRSETRLPRSPTTCTQELGRRARAVRRLAPQDPRLTGLPGHDDPQRRLPRRRRQPRHLPVERQRIWLAATPTPASRSVGPGRRTPSRPWTDREPTSLPARREGHEPVAQISLVDLLDRLLGTGVVLAGDVVISLAGVDLVQVRLHALITTVRADMAAPRPAGRGDRRDDERRHSLTQRLETDPESVERDLFKLVLTDRRAGAAADGGAGAAARRGGRPHRRAGGGARDRA